MRAGVRAPRRAVQGARDRGHDVSLPELAIPTPDRPGAADPVVRGADDARAAGANLDATLFTVAEAVSGG